MIAFLLFPKGQGEEKILASHGNISYSTSGSVAERLIAAILKIADG